MVVFELEDIAMESKKDAEENNLVDLMSLL